MSDVTMAVIVGRPNGLRVRKILADYPTISDVQTAEPAPFYGARGKMDAADWQEHKDSKRAESNHAARDLVDVCAGAVSNAPHVEPVLFIVAADALLAGDGNYPTVALSEEWADIIGEAMDTKHHIVRVLPVASRVLTVTN